MTENNDNTANTSYGLKGFFTVAVAMPIAGLAMIAVENAAVIASDNACSALAEVYGIINEVVESLKEGGFLPKEP